jgi:hypothetical protein
MADVTDGGLMSSAKSVVCGYKYLEAVEAEDGFPITVDVTEGIHYFFTPLHYLTSFIGDFSIQPPLFGFHIKEHL